MKNPKEISISEYDYPLPKERIAYHPLDSRSSSKLLHFDGSVHDRTFSDLPNLLDENHCLVFNNTRVINARIWFRKSTGKIIEIFCLEPKNLDMAEALAQKCEATWICLIGGAKAWKESELKQSVVIDEVLTNLEVRKGERVSDGFEVHFSWDNDGASFGEVLEMAGKVPLPPYIKREAEEDDYERYQTVFSRIEGSVAAPTAGLHFDDGILSHLKARNVQNEQLTLHVGAGTFKPVVSEEIGEHAMHKEAFEITKAFIEKLINNPKLKIIAVGTTSLRTLESMYWMGVKLLINKDNPFVLEQWEVYEMEELRVSRKDALLALYNFLDGSNSNLLLGSTGLMIAPGYRFKIITGLVTNFHLPKSTLLLLVSALVGDAWKNIYDHALKSEYRFLSYGDSSLLLPE